MSGPKKNDQSDVRCAFVGTRPGKHDLGKVPTEAWCYGCAHYICESCDSPFGVITGNSHDVTKHDPSSDEYD